MKKILLILLLINLFAKGQSIEIRPDNNSLLNIKDTNNQPFEVKNDSVFIRKSVLQFVPSESSISDQSSRGNIAFSIGFFSSLGQTFKAGRNGQLTTLRLQTTHAYSNVTLRVFKGTSASGTLLSTTVFNQLGGTRDYILDQPAQMIAGEMYFFDISPAFSHHFSNGIYLDGEHTLTQFGNTSDVMFETFVKPDPLVIYGNTGDIKGAGFIEGNGSKLTNISTDALATTVTKQGNTFNGANQLLKLNSSGFITQESLQAPVLQNGWENHGGGFENAGFWKDKEGLVHLQGLIRSGTIANSTVLFTLPTGYRPQVRLIFTILNNNAVGRIDLLPTGEMIIANVSSNLWLNLTGIYFRTN
jgi:hypothetical protein